MKRRVIEALPIGHGKVMRHTPRSRARIEARTEKDVSKALSLINEGKLSVCKAGEILLDGT